MHTPSTAIGHRRHIQGHTYIVDDKRMFAEGGPTGHTARCEAMGGHLVTIETEAENTCVYSIMSSELEFKVRCQPP